MPIWGQILTSEQLDALVQYTFQAAQGSPIQLGQGLFAQNCASCHGEFGEGGPNPANAAEIIPPISTAAFLQTRDDSTIRAIIAQGQSDLGMPPFAASNGGLLSDDEIDAIVAFVRSWAANPLVIEPTPSADPNSQPLRAFLQWKFMPICALNVMAHLEQAGQGRH